MSEDFLPLNPLTHLEPEMSISVDFTSTDVRRLQKMQPDMPQPDLSIRENLCWGEEEMADSLNLLLFPRAKTDSDSL